jgi:hypothetical protein
LPKKGSHFEKENEKIIKIYVLAKKEVRGLERHPDIYPFLSIS